jgi:hypothetical protein
MGQSVLRQVRNKAPMDRLALALGPKQAQALQPRAMQSVDHAGGGVEKIIKNVKNVGARHQSGRRLFSFLCKTTMNCVRIPLTGFV